MTIQVLNGANLGRLGLREPDKYGTTTYAELVELLEETGRGLGLEVRVRQTDDESEMLRWVHSAADAGDPVVINPAGWAHTSVVLRDAESVSDLARRYPISFAAVHKHVGTLERAGLVTKTRHGREQHVRGDLATLRSAHGLLDDLEAVWRGRIDRIEQVLADPMESAPR